MKMEARLEPTIRATYKFRAKKEEEGDPLKRSFLSAKCRRGGVVTT
jgi:hypothetical protein